MFNSLTGILTRKNAGSVYLRTAGIEWDIIMSDASIRKLPAAGEEARIPVYLHHKEDVMSLFGFYDETERILFHDLLKVSGIGPKQAVRILSGISAEMLVKCLDSGDVDYLSRIPGLGKKTAQKIVLALRGKLSLEASEEEAPDRDIIEALVEMGFERKAASEAVKKASTEASDAEGSEREQLVFRKAIILLST